MENYLLGLICERCVFHYILTGCRKQKWETTISTIFWKDRHETIRLGMWKYLNQKREKEEEDGNVWYIYI